MREIASGEFLFDVSVAAPSERWPRPDHIQAFVPLDGDADGINAIVGDRFTPANLLDSNDAVIEMVGKAFVCAAKDIGTAQPKAAPK